MITKEEEEEEDAFLWLVRLARGALFTATFWVVTLFAFPDDDHNDTEDGSRFAFAKDDAVEEVKDERRFCVVDDIISSLPTKFKLTLLCFERECVLIREMWFSFIRERKE